MTSHNPVSQPLLSRTVRVFISSTFRDFVEERDLLMKRVFPELHRRARDRLVEVVGIDLRWGITEKQSKAGRTLPICLHEIERSRPYFIGLLGDRYGWTPTADSYSKRLVEAEPWLKEHIGGKSATELEILHGVLNNPEIADRARFYIRQPQKGRVNRAILRDQGVDALEKLARLKQRVRSSRFPTTDYATPAEFAEHVLEDLWKMIATRFPAKAIRSEVAKRRCAHDAFAADRRRVFVGRDALVARLVERCLKASDKRGLSAADSRVTLVAGEAGSGKSAVVANAMERYRQCANFPIVIEHYIGCELSTDENAQWTSAIIRRIADEIECVSGPLREWRDEGERLERFAALLREASRWAVRAKRTIVVALDGLDRVSDSPYMGWIPARIPPRVRLVLSCANGEYLDELQRRELTTIVVGGLSKVSARKLIHARLERQRRSLDDASKRAILLAPQSRSIGWLCALLDELQVVPSHLEVPRKVRELSRTKDTTWLLRAKLRRLEADIGQRACLRICMFLSPESIGVQRSHLIGRRGVKPIEWAHFEFAFESDLFMNGGAIRTSHQLREACGIFVARAGGSEESCHALLARGLQDEPPETVCGASLGLHLSGARDVHGMLAHLCEQIHGAYLLANPECKTLLALNWDMICEEKFVSNPSQFIERFYHQAVKEWGGFPGASKRPQARWVEAAEGLAEFLEDRPGESEFALQIRDALRKMEEVSARSPKRHTNGNAELQEINATSTALLTPAQATKQSRDFIAQDRALVRQRPTLSRRQGLCASLAVHAHDLLRGGTSSTASKFAMQSVCIAEQLVREHGAPESVRALANSLVILSCVQRANTLGGAAQKSLLRAVELRRKLVDPLGVAEDRIALCDALGLLEGSESARRGVKALERRSAIIEEILEMMSEHQDDLEPSEFQSKSLTWIDRSARVEERLGNFADALMGFNYCRRSAAKLCRAAKNNRTLNNHIYYVQRCARCLIRLGKRQQALVILQRAQPGIERLTAEAGDCASYLDTIRAYHRAVKLARVTRKS